MSWPFGVNFTNQTQYISNIPNYCQSFYPSQFTSNQLMNVFTNNYFNYSQAYAIYSHNCAPIEQNNLIIQNQQLIQSFNDQNSNNISLSKVQENSQQSKEKLIKQSSFSEGSIRMVRFRRRRKVKKVKSLISHNSSLRNDTKNIPKNYGKAMLAYIQKNTRQAKQLLSEHDVDFMEFLMKVKSFKTKINTIHDLRQMWGENCSDDIVKKCIRVLSFHFMRKKCLPYIFNSRVKNFHTHIKYRKKIMEGLENPQNFTKIKEF